MEIILSLTLGIVFGAVLGSIGTIIFFKSQLKREQETFKNLQETSQLQFQVLAEKILEEKSKKIGENNSEHLKHLNAVLKPLGENLEIFKKQIYDTYEKSSKQNVRLEEHIKNLSEQTNKISAEANNLTNALKGQTKTQGDWGEMILERVLESSGLVKGREYDMQVNIKNENAQNIRPDAIVYLPENRKIIIDSKVSLNAYEKFYAAETKAEQELLIKAHLKSIQEHIQELSDKHYEDSVPQAPDFTMLFIPIEPAYLLALQKDPELWEKAYKKHILLISPTNLIACLRMVEFIWRQESIAQNAQTIAEMGGKLYDKLMNVLESFDELGKSLTKATDAYEQTMKRLKNGRGDVISQSQKLLDLGIKPNKKLPERFQ